MILPVILSGGSGTRLWPLSRKMHPKQLLPLVNENSLLQGTLNRFKTATDIVHAIVICNEEYRFMVAEQVRQTHIKGVDIILEPVGRNTAPAITLAAFNAIHGGTDPVLLVLPADHDIRKVEDFLKAITLGEIHAMAGRLVTFGVVPDKPETGYGYIKAKQPTGKDGVLDVERFVEKPDSETAQSYIEDENYYWNSGMFMFRASVYLEALQLHARDIYQACELASNGANRDMDFVRIDKTAFMNCRSDSVDYAIMEKADNVAMIPIDIGWNDVGSWAALQDLAETDADNNALLGDVKIQKVKNCYIRAEDHLVVALGVENLIIVDTDDALLVAHRNHVQDIKAIVEQLGAEARAEVLLHKRVCRPWGCYQNIDSSVRFQVKRITVNPGAALSLQKHHHRSEHWIVVKGMAKVTRGEEEFTVSENESTYIPVGMKHRLGNIGKIPLELIEVQTGGYLGEDDIVRFDDVYGRGGE